MAKKMYYTEEEAAAALGMDVSELATLVGEGKLRVYQDGARKMYKVDEVDALGGPVVEEEGEIELAPADTTAGADAVSLSEADAELPATKEDTVITAEGISIFDDEDLEIEVADPMAKTQIAPSLEDQIALEGVGSGSGLLDLTRESDDTSLGAEVLDHIDMEGAVDSDIQSAPSGEPGAYPPPPPVPAEPMVVEAIDPTAGLFNGMIIGCCLVALLLGGIMLSAMTGFVPSYLAGLKDHVLIALVVCVVVVSAAAVVGLFVGKSVAARHEAMRRVG